MDDPDPRQRTHGRSQVGHGSWTRSLLVHRSTIGLPATSPLKAKVMLEQKIHFDLTGRAPPRRVPRTRVQLANADKLASRPQQDIHPSSFCFQESSSTMSNQAYCPRNKTLVDPPRCWFCVAMVGNTTSTTVLGHASIRIFVCLSFGRWTPSRCPVPTQVSKGGPFPISMEPRLPIEPETVFPIERFVC